MTHIEQYLEEGAKGHINIPRRVLKQYDKLIPIIEGKDARWCYNPKMANKPIEFAERFCRQSKDAWVGQPMRLLLWQKAGIEAVYGIVERETGVRKHQRILELCAKKNGKTTKMAPIALYETAKNGNEVYSAANGFDQSRIVWTEAKNMLSQSPQLQTVLKGGQYKIKNIRPNGFSIFQALANNPDMLEGKLPKFVILDEIHLLNHDIYTILHDGQISVRDPVIWMLTTKGFLREGLFDTEYKNSCDIIDGIVDDERKFSLLYELDDPADWQNEDQWQQANPSIGTIITYEALRDKVRDALNKPKILGDVKTKHFNVGSAGGGAYFEFDAINNEKTFDLKRFRNKTAIGGIDLSRTNDLTSFATLVFDANAGEFLLETMYWISRRFYKKSVEDPRMGQTWRLWVEQGMIEIAGEDIIDHSAIVRYILKMTRKYNLVYRWVYYDPYTAPYLIADLNNNGFAAGDCLVKCHQGLKTFAVPIQLLDVYLRNKKVNYNNNPVTKWCLTNVEMVEDRNGNQLPIKAGSNEKRKIDGYMTLLDAFVGFCDHGAEIGVTMNGMV